MALCRWRVSDAAAGRLVAADAEGHRATAGGAVGRPPAAEKALDEEGQRGLGWAAFELLVDTLEDDATPAPVGLVLVNLEADVRVGAHDSGLAALDRLDVGARAVPDVDHRHDIGLALRVTAHSAYELTTQERVDLALIELLDHTAIFAHNGRALVREFPDPRTWGVSGLANAAPKTRQSRGTRQGW